MKLFRVFPWEGKSLGHELGGPLFVPRERQGITRHGIPDRDGVLYTAKSPIGAIAERIQVFRGQKVIQDDLFFNGAPLSIAELELASDISILALEDPREMVANNVDPLEVATRDYSVAQRLAARLFDQGIAGFSWRSSLEPAWINVSLFESRTAQSLRVVGKIVPLLVTSIDLQKAAKHIGVFL